MTRLNRQEQGVVSILTVLFFIILMSVIVLGFLRIVSDEQTQTLDDDLTRRALSSSQSGVEDAKRALMFCRKQTGLTRTACFEALNNPNCPGIFGPAVSASNPIPAGLGVTLAADMSVRVGSSANFNQRYTCVVTRLRTEDVVGQLKEGLADFIPLRGIADFDKVRLSWHQTGVGGDGNVVLPTALSVPFVTNPRRPLWNNAGTSYLATVRLQLIAYDKTQPLSAQDNNSAGMYIVPYNASTPGLSSSFSINSVSPTWTADKRIEVRCSGPVAGYTCSATMNLGGTALPSANRDLYLLLRSVYNTPHYKLELLNGSNVVLFDNVEPAIDSTGAADDTYRRTITRVKYEGVTFYTTNAIEGGGNVCKDFAVTNNTAFSGTCIIF